MKFHFPANPFDSIKKNKNFKIKVNKIEHFDNEIDDLMDSPWVYKKGINQNMKFMMEHSGNFLQAQHTHTA